MTTATREVQVSLLDDRINILDRNTAEDSRLKQVFGAVSAILALVRDEMISDNDSVQLSDHCFSVCEALKAMIQERTSDFGESAKAALEKLERVIREIERTLRTGANTSRIGYDKGKIDGHKLEIRRILDALDIRNPSLNANRPDDSVVERAFEHLSLDSRDTPAASAPEKVFERLIRREFVPDQLPSLIQTVLVCKDVDDITRRLPKDDAQTLVDVLDEALDSPDLSLSARVKCLRRLYRTCGFHGILPKRLKVPACYDHNVYPLYKGGFADVWKGEHDGREVAVKVIRTYSRKNLKKIIGRFCKEVITWKSLQHHNVLPLVGVMMSEDQFAMVSDWMENGNINEFVEENPDADRLGLLGDVAKGLIYIHQRGMIHGDLKGANILIDPTGHARLADFGLLTVASDPTTLLPQSSYAHGGTMRWMSPELIAPEKFGFKTSHPTKSSDCYALGMVIYETISGNSPFHKTPDIAVFLKVIEGERPHREEGFVESLWEMVEQCWAPQPSGRPSVESVLERLEMCSKSSAPSSLGMEKGADWNLWSDGKSVNEGTDTSMCHHCQLTNIPVRPCGPEGQLLCDSCGLFCEKHGVARPLQTLGTDYIEGRSPHISAFPDNPRRVLTKPSEPAYNDGYDNEDGDYILHVNDWLESGDGHNYLILDILGQGTSGQVVKCQNVKTHELVAVKVVKNKTTYFNQGMMEVTILELLNNQYDPNDQHHVLRLRDSFIHRGHICLVLELLSSSLYELIKQNQFQGLSTQLVMVFTAQLLDSLTVLKEARLIHCDLSPENILLESLQSPQIKVIDFGSACHERQAVYTYVQSRFYRSPEVLLGIPYNAAIDMWSLGCIAVELFLGIPLFPGTSEYNQITRIVEMLGMPPTYMMDLGKQTGHFFDSYTDALGHKKYRLKTVEQYSRERNTNEQPGKQYFKATTLSDIINQAPIPNFATLRHGTDIEKELSRRASFIDFCQGLLNLNPVERWTPQQARQHPFITGEKFTKPWSQHAQNPVPQTSSQHSVAPANPKRPHGGLVPSQPKGTGAFLDAALYNQYLAQQQAYIPQSTSLVNASNTENPYTARLTGNKPSTPPSNQDKTVTGYNYPTNSDTSAQQLYFGSNSSLVPHNNQHPPAAPYYPNMNAGTQAEGIDPTGDIHPALASAMREWERGQTGDVAVAQPYSQLEYRSNGNQMDIIPPALQRVDQDMPYGGKNALTPVLNRDDAIREWERRQTGNVAVAQPYDDVIGEGERRQARKAAMIVESLESRPPPKIEVSKSQGDKPASSGSWLSRWWRKEDGAPVKIDIAEESSFYYDRELKRWVKKPGKGGN